jgi:conjugal transfer pilus assembly protein TraD
MFLLEGLVRSFAHLVIVLAVIGLLSLCGGTALALGLRLRGLRWTWGALPIAPAMLVGHLSTWLALLGGGSGVIGCLVGMALQARDLTAGGEYAEAARARLGLLGALRRGFERRQALHRPRAWVSGERLQVGRDEHGTDVTVPAGGVSGSHTLILGATGSGKTCSEAWIAARLVEHGHGAVAIDPKGDRMLCEELQRAAHTAGAPFLSWSPNGPNAYNPYAQGAPGEIADKALSGEVFTEPHYLRQAQRYLGHAVRAMRAAQIDVTAASLMAHMSHEQLEQTAKMLPAESMAALHEYLDSLSERQKQDLTGVRDRLSILAESDIAAWLDPAGGQRTIDLERQVREGAVVYFSLEADRWPLLAKMLAGAIVGDLIALAGALQSEPVPTVVAIDEFSGVAAEQVARLFARGRSAGMSLLLATQELADLKVAGNGALREQVLGNVGALIAHRQNVPESAELIAAVAGTRPAWVTVQHTSSRLVRRPTGGGSRKRVHEQIIHPTQIKQLRTGQAAVIAPASDRLPVIAQIHHPREAHSAPTVETHGRQGREARSHIRGARIGASAR